VTVTGRATWANVMATPYVPGQVVTVHVWNGRRLIKSQTVALRRSRGGDYGHYSVRFTSGSAGNLDITAVHVATPQLVSLAAAPKKVDVVLPIAGPGSSGMFVSLIQSRLAALHFAVPQDGVYDELTQNAILAYRKLRGFDRIFTLDGPTVHGLLTGIGAFPVRFPGQGKHVEADLTDQVLALINGSQVFRIYPISSGKPSTPTVLGNYRVYMKTPGYLPDGMYYSNFFYTGYAIHGYDPSPTYPASHGCLRLPIDDAINVYNWIQIGTPVDVYYGAN
jgi:peptidoglycan hydrolase-like protein with peptidoglycan-binding domain